MEVKPSVAFLMVFLGAHLWKVSVENSIRNYILTKMSFQQVLTHKLIVVPVKGPLMY
jgi:hypothetical protein